MPEQAYFPARSQREIADAIDRELLGYLRRAASRNSQRFVAINYRELAQSIHLCQDEPQDREEFIRERLRHFVKIGIITKARCGDVCGFVVPKAKACMEMAFTRADEAFLRDMGIGV
jgi:hypothetical protein